MSKPKPFTAKRVADESDTISTGRSMRLDSADEQREARERCAEILNALDEPELCDCGACSACVPPWDHPDYWNGGEA